MSKDWHLYILRCANGDLYTGITTDVGNRFEQHQQGKGAKAHQRSRPFISRIPNLCW
jgi:putative endonuclease